MAKTQVVTADPKGNHAAAVRRGVEVWRAGGVVAFPTETVYGVGVRADLPEAVARLRQIKRRDEDMPFTVHLGRRTEVERFVPNLSGLGRRFVQKGWPGPLTLVFCGVDAAAAPIMASVPPATASVMYHQGTVGLRCPDDGTAAELLCGVEAPVVAASANLPGRRPPCAAAEVLAALDGQIDLLVDAGPARYAKASTIVRVNGQVYEVLREGVYDERTVRRLATLNILLVCTGNTCRSPMAAALLGKLLAAARGIATDQLETQGIKIVSAGTGAASGGSASPEAVEVMRNYGLDISGHRSQALSAELINQADFILAMTRSHRDAVTGLVPSASECCTLIDAEREIADPMGQPVDVYAACARAIESALTTRVDEVLA